ncbi:MAG: hypothetical protein HGA31_03255 [Candidatus Moranbacteria bacterium]|nr:hypothetical protein [Candidatus Moranbacteria bacterium]
MTDTALPSTRLTEEQSRTVAIAGIILCGLAALYVLSPFFFLVAFRQLPDWSIGITNEVFGAFGYFFCFQTLKRLRENIPAADDRHLRNGIVLFSATAISFIAILVSIMIPLLSVVFMSSSMAFWTSERMIAFLGNTAAFIGTIYKLSMIATIIGIALIFSGLQNPNAKRS